MRLLRFEHVLAAALTIGPSLFAGRLAHAGATKSADSCTPTVVVVERAGVIWYGNEPHSKSVLIGALCREDVPAASSEAKKDLSAWLQKAQEQDGKAGHPGQRICGSDRARDEPSPELLAEATKRLKGLRDWCWILGKAEVP